MSLHLIAQRASPTPHLGAPADLAPLADEALLDAMEEAADTLVAALNTRSGGDVWSYRAPVQARHAARNAWVSIVRTEDLGRFLPDRQLFLRLNDEGTLDAGLMAITTAPEQVTAALRQRVGTLGFKRGLRRRMTVDQVTPILAQVQETCDLPAWQQAAKAIQTREAVAVAAQFPVEVDVLIDDLDAVLIPPLMKLAALAEMLDTPDAAPSTDDSDGPADQTEPAPEVHESPLARLQALCEAIAPGAFAVSQAVADGPFLLRVQETSEGSADHVSAELCLDAPAPCLTLIAGHRYHLSAYGGRTAVLDMNRARQTSRDILAPLAALGFALTHRSILLSETPRGTERDAQIVAHWAPDDAAADGTAPLETALRLMHALTRAA